MIVIKRVDLGSAFKVGAIIGLITSAVFGIFFVGLQGMAFSAFTGLATLSNSSATFDSRGTAFPFAAAGLATLCFMYVLYVVLAAIGGGIGGFITAFAYNLAARWVGGLTLELEGNSGKAKRSYDFDDIYE